MLNLSFLRRNIFDHLDAYRTKSPRYDYFKLINKTQFFSYDELKKIQWKRLKALLDFVYHKNTFYKRLFEKIGIQPSDIKSFNEFKKLPIISKNEIRSNSHEMVSDGFDSNKLLEFKTGGSTGVPLKLKITEECSEMRNAVARRHDTWAGWHVGEPIAAVWGNPPQRKKTKEILRHFLIQPIIYLDTMNLNDTAVKNFAQKWKKTKPTLLFGHSHSIYSLAKYISDLAVSEIKPVAIITSSMMLIPHERSFIESVFKAPVTDRYGCEEVSLIASQCELHDGYHMNIEHLYIEFLDEKGNDVPLGEPGRIVVTDLMNYAMPFIRYDVGDIGICSGRMCSCGRGLPVMDSIVGRTADFLVKKDGSKVAGVSLIENTLTKIDGIEQMQLIQSDLDSLEICIVANNGFTKERENELVQYFENLFDIRGYVHIKRVNEIARDPSGKYRFSISKVNPT